MEGNNDGGEGKEKLDCASEFEVKRDEIQWLGGGDKTGTPGNFTATQNFGFIKFSWTDRSLCEEAYSLSREISNGGGGRQAFIEDAYFAGNKQCGENVNIPTVADNLFVNPEEQAVPGESREYCLRAVSNSGVGVQGYASDTTCKTVVVAWEAAIQGRVLSRLGNVPVAGVHVTWKIKDPAGNVILETDSLYEPDQGGNRLGKRIYNKAAVSDADGRFILHIVDHNAAIGTPHARTVHLDYWKESVDGTFHKFWCPDDEICGGDDVMHENGEPTRQKYVVADTLDYRSCSDLNLKNIETEAECESAASAHHLGLQDMNTNDNASCKRTEKQEDCDQTIVESSAPYGCSYNVIKDKAWPTDGRLWLSNNTANDKKKYYLRICRNDAFVNSTNHNHAVEHTVIASHLTFDTPVTITDATTVPFGGKVYFPLEVKVLSQDEAAAHRRLSVDNQKNPEWPREWSSSSNHVPLQTAEVCLHAYSEGNEKIVCTTTGEDGSFALAAVPGTPFVVQVTLGSHEPADFALALNAKDGPDLSAVLRMKPSLLPGIECDDCMQVFTLSADDESFSKGMDYEDRTTRLLDVDVHGTLCKHRLGRVSFMKFADHGCGTSNCLSTSAELPTAYQTNNLVLLPAQVLDVTLEAVEPPYEEATAFTQFGYFHRLRIRTQRIDLFDEFHPPQREAEEGSSQNKATHYAAVFQYHPAPVLELDFFKNKVADGRSDLQPLDPTLCKHGSALDTSTGVDLGLGATKSHQAPGWVMPTGMPFAAEVKPVATITFPREKPATCDWIVGKVEHESYLGFSRADRHHFKVDQVTKAMVPKDVETTAYKEFAKIVNKTLPPQVTREDLVRCGNPEEPECSVSTVHSTALSLRADFSDDATCTSPQHANELHLQFGYNIFDGDAKSCASQWASHVSKAGLPFHAWHLLDWSRDLSVSQQKAWESVNITEELYRRGKDTPTWRYFSKVVLASAPLWSSLENDVRNILADELGFTSDTWGRAWAFADRIFLNDTTVLPDWNEDLTYDEQKALNVLGYTAVNWAEPDNAKCYKGVESDAREIKVKDPHATSYVYENAAAGDFTIRDWDDLFGPEDEHHNQQGNLSNVLKITRWHWMRAKTAAAHGERVDGCFWDRGRGHASTRAWISSVSAPDSDGSDDRRRHRARRQVNDHTFVRMCPAGQESERDRSLEDGSVCIPCKDGYFKSSSMSLNAACKQKLMPKACNKTEYFHPGSSAVADDNICIPNGQCARGFEKLQLSQEQCSACPKGQFKDLVSDSRCAAKKTGTCKPGQYTIRGDDTTIDDTLCVSCSLGTFSAAGNTSQCTSKRLPVKCNPGMFLQMTTSTTKDDNVCTACPAGTWKGGTALPTSCTPKSVTECQFGEYLFSGSSTKMDDNKCIACPDGTFAPEISSAASCRSKSVTFCQTGQTFHRGGSQTEDDNVCVSPGFCPAGYYNKSKADGCSRCPEGRFSSRITNASTYTECDLKSVTNCSLGKHVFLGDSVTSDDSRCVSCPSGTYKGLHHSVETPVCFLKRALNTSCPAGKHVSRGLSRTSDDHECQGCPEGTFQPTNYSNTKLCRLKAQPFDGCPAGKFLSLGNSTVEDDFECKNCEEGQFKSHDAPSESTSCTPKITEKECSKPKVFYKTVNDSTQDNICVLPAQCGVGERVADDKIKCTPCLEGQYNPFPSAQSSCQNKTNVLKCDPGTFFSKGNSTARNDWQCIECRPGTYSKNSTTGAGCTSKVLPFTFPDEAVPVCGPGEEVYWGKSKIQNDWFCVPASQYTALCAKSRQFGARSLMQGMAAGMPLQVVPFTTKYVAKMSVAGYPPVVAVETVVITGSRYVSDAEKVPFPEGRPLIVLHDPPGGGSFSSFANTRATTSVEVHDIEDWSGAGLDYRFHAGGGADQTVVPSGTKVLKFNLGGTYGGGKLWGWSDRAVRQEEIDDETFMFTYQTSDEPDRAGPPSDTFLMPSLTFEVIEVWSVKFAANSSTNDCKIRGFTDRSLKTRKDLSAFYFITANDVETRTLPALLHFSKDVKARLDCDDGKGCCTKEEEDVFCKASNLAEYCDWKYKKGGNSLDLTGGFARCISIAEDHWKTKCKAAAKQARAFNEADAFWSDCVRAELEPTCPNQEDGPLSTPQFRPVGTKVLCEQQTIEDEDENTEPVDVAVLEAAAPKLDRKQLRGQAESALADASKCVDGMCFAVESSFKIKCARVPTTIENLAECSKGGIKASSVEEYCSKKHTELLKANADCGTCSNTQLTTANECKGASEVWTLAGGTCRDSDPARKTEKECNVPEKECKRASNVWTPTKSEAECTTFTPSDQYSQAHDNWYNSLSRNYAKQEKAIVGPDVTVYYSVLDSLTGRGTPVPTSEFVDLEPMTSLTPTMLIQNAMDKTGSSQSDGKKASFEAYNTLSFEGGGSSMAYTWETGGTANGNDFGGHVTESMHIRKSDEFNRDYVGFSGAVTNPLTLVVDVFGSGSKAAIKLNTRLETSLDESHAAFTLSDPDPGDYFVVTVWNDPEYPTPIFAVRGGASSCKWEYNTYHRVAPAMSMEYAGPHFLPPTAPALFKLQLENSAQYYESGPATGKSRPGWTEIDKGYFLPAVSLAVWPESIKHGLTLWINGRAFTGDVDLTFPQFGKGSAEVLVEVFAGPVGQEPATPDMFRTYPSPVFAFGQECNQKHAIRDIGERAVDVALKMAGTITAPVVRFLQPCPAVEWSGNIKATGTFIIDAKKGSEVDFVVSNPSGTNWLQQHTSKGGIFDKLVFQFRYVQSGGHAPSKWFPDIDKSFGLDLIGSEDKAFIQGAWTGPEQDFPDGVYQIRIISSCFVKGVIDDGYAQSSTTTLQGVVDRKPPTLLSAKADPGSTVLLPGMFVVATFDEIINCDGMNSMSGKRVQPEMTITTTAEVEGVKSVEFAIGNGFLDYSCDGKAISIAITQAGVETFNLYFPDPTVLAGTTASLSLEGGVVDAAGNVATGEMRFFLPLGEIVGIADSIANSAGHPGAVGSKGDGKPATLAPTLPATPASTLDNDEKQSADTADTAGSDRNDEGHAGEDSDSGTSSSSSNGALPGAVSSDSHASAAGGGGSTASSSSYVSMVFIILVLVAAFVYNRQAFANLSDKLDSARNQTILPESIDRNASRVKIGEQKEIEETAFNERHVGSRGSFRRSIRNEVQGTGKLLGGMIDSSESADYTDADKSNGSEPAAEAETNNEQLPTASAGSVDRNIHNPIYNTVESSSNSATSRPQTVWTESRPDLNTNGAENRSEPAAGAQPNNEQPPSSESANDLTANRAGNGAAAAAPAKTEPAPVARPLAVAQTVTDSDSDGDDGDNWDIDNDC